jgi:two-component system, NarL family, nitrate/nitrite response regulator NarL
MLRCVIVDDSPVFLAAATSLLEGQGASVVGVAQTPEEAIRQVTELRPDLTLLDIHLGAESGFELAGRLFREVGVEPRRMVMISTDAGDDHAQLVSESPVAGFLTKTALSVSGIRELMALEG